MDDETQPRAMGYICVDLVKTIHGLNFRMRRIASRLGYDYIGLTRSTSWIVPEALLDHVATHRIELLVVPGLSHLRGRFPPDLAEITDLHDLATGITHERFGGYVPPDRDVINPLAPEPEG